MSLSYVTITETFAAGNDVPLSGTVIFTPSETVYDASGPLVSADNPITVQVISGVLQSVELLATDNEGLTYAGMTGFFFWSVAIVLGGVSQQGWSFFLPSSPGTVDLYALANTAAAGGFANPMTTPGDLIDGGASGTPERLAIGDDDDVLTVVDGAPDWQAPSPALPLTTLGDTVYEDATPEPARLPGSTSATKMFYTQTGTGSESAAPEWDTVTPSDLGATADQAGYSPLLLNPAAGMIWGYPWKFDLFSYGAAGNGFVVTDGAMSSSSNPTHLVCSTSSPFTSAMVGRHVVVGGAGGSTYTPLYATISSYVSASTVALSVSATSTVSGAIVKVATDDTAAVKEALAAAYSYGSGAVITIDPFLFGIAAAPTVGGGTLGNAQIPLPLGSETGEKFIVTFQGTGGDITPLAFFDQTMPQYAGPFLMCMAAGTNDGTYGPASMIGGPYDGYGGFSGEDETFANICPVVDQVGLLLDYNGTIGGWNFFGCSEAILRNWAVLAAAIQPESGAVPSMYDPNNISNQYPAGVWMPDVDNNALAEMGHGSVEGVAVGAFLSEHSRFTSIRSAFCVAGVQVGSLSSTSMPHSCGGEHLLVQTCFAGVIGADASSNVFIRRVDCESVTYHAYDPDSYLNGEIGFTYNGTEEFAYGALAIDGASVLRIIDLHQPTGAIASPQGAPLTTVAWQNQYYRDAWITVALSGDNTFTSLDINSVAQPNAAGASTYAFLLPAGQSYTPTYSAGTLTHTVSLS